MSDRPKPVRCAIYTRKSTEHNLDLEFNSLHAQREACEAYTRTNELVSGWGLFPTPEMAGFAGETGASRGFRGFCSSF